VGGQKHDEVFENVVRQPCLLLGSVRRRQQKKRVASKRKKEEEKKRRVACGQMTLHKVIQSKTVILSS